MKPHKTLGSEYFMRKMNNNDREKNIKLPKMNDVVVVLFDYLYKNKKINLKKTIDDLAEKLSITEEQKKITYERSREYIFKNTVYFSRLQLIKMGLAKTEERLHIAITKKGETFYNKYQDSPKMLLELKKETDKNIRKEKEETLDDSSIYQENEDIVEESLNTVLQLETLQKSQESNLIVELKDYLQNNITPRQFENIILKILEKIGYGKATITNYSKDNGVDGILDMDQLGLEKIYTQAKRYTSDHKVSSPKIQEFMGALVAKGWSKGIFVTTTTFTKDAIKMAEKSSNKNLNIALLNVYDLINIMIKHDIGIKTKKIFKLKEVDEDFFF